MVQATRAGTITPAFGHPADQEGSFYRREPPRQPKRLPPLLRKEGSFFAPVYCPNTS